MNIELIDDIARYNLINQLYSYLPEEELINLKDIIGVETALSISPAGREINNPISSLTIRFELKWMPDNDSIFINLPDYFLSEFLNKISGGINNCALTPAGLALIEYICLKIILRKINPEITSRLRWIGLIKDKIEDNKLHLVFRINFMDGVYFFSIGFSDRVAQELIRMMAVKNNIEKFPAVSVSIIPVLAEGEIKADELKGIQPGDVIAFREAYIKIYDDGKKGGVIMLKTGENELIGGYDIDNEKFFLKNENKDEHSEQKNNIEEIIQNIPITLSVELKRIKVPLRDLSQLLPGQLLNIKRMDLDEVLISANGMTIGTGRLVKIDETLCVEVLTLND